MQTLIAGGFIVVAFDVAPTVMTAVVLLWAAVAVIGFIVDACKGEHKPNRF